MNIALDARWIFEQLSGIGAYTLELIRHLPQADPVHEYTLIFSDPGLLERTLSATGLAGHPRFKPVLFPCRVFSPASQARLPLLLRRLKADVYHSTNFMIPFLAFPRHRAGRVRCVTTIHDVIPLIFPDSAPKSKKARLFPLYRRLMIEVGTRSDRIVTDSENSRADILAHLRISPGERPKVQAIPIGVSPLFKPAAKKAAAFKTVLYVGRLDPYKNVAGLVRVFARVKQSLHGNVRLTIAGPPDPRYPEARRLAGELGLEAGIRWTGYLPDAELLEAYQQADALALLSKYEGFGLPVIEAMACGTPVVCGNGSSLPEVAGDAAVLVNPDDPEQAAAALVRVLEDPAFAAALREKGLRRAAQFTWLRTAQETVRTYLRAKEGGVA